MSEPLLEIDGLTVDLPLAGDRAHAVRDVSLRLHRGEILCIVGESGSGKSVTANTIMGLLPPDSLKVRSGRILFDGQDLLTLPEPALRKLRGARIAMIFQEPMTSLNPVMTIGRQIEEVMEAHGVPAAERQARVLSLLEAVGLPDPPSIARSYPFRLSGGQRQRVMIAMALALEPDILIADEPTTALDVTTQLGILRLLDELRRERHLAVLFVTHDLAVARLVCQRVAVMYAGLVVEAGPIQTVLSTPRHPYTRALLDADPGLAEAPRTQLRAIPGQPPPLNDLPPGCPFAPRCPLAEEACTRAIPPTETFGEVSVRCIKAGDAA